MNGARKPKLSSHSNTFGKVHLVVPYGVIRMLMVMVVAMQGLLPVQTSGRFKNICASYLENVSITMAQTEPRA